MSPVPQIALAEHGIQNLMCHLGMPEGTAEPNNCVVWLRDYQVITSPVTGMFRATVRDVRSPPGH